MTPPEIEPATFWLVALYLKQLRHREPFTSNIITNMEGRNHDETFGSLEM
jgi:hypothetical protein